MAAIHLAIYYLRGGLAWLWFAIASLLILIFVLPFRWKDPSGGALLGRLGSRVSARILGMRVRILNEEKLYLHQPCVYVCNHQSNFDIIAGGTIYPYRSVVIAKREIERIPIVGWALTGIGSIFIERTKRADAFAGFNAARHALEERGVSIFVMPEGHRNYGTQELLPFKKGAFRMALLSQVPIVPIVISIYVDEQTGRLCRRDLTVKVLDPIQTKGKTLTDLPSVLEEARKRMQETLSAPPMAQPPAVADVRKALVASGTQTRAQKRLEKKLRRMGRK